VFPYTSDDLPCTSVAAAPLLQIYSRLRHFAVRGQIRAPHKRNAADPTSPGAGSSLLLLRSVEYLCRPWFAQRQRGSRSHLDAADVAQPVSALSLVGRHAIQESATLEHFTIVGRSADKWKRQRGARCRPPPPRGRSTGLLGSIFVASSCRPLGCAVECSTGSSDADEASAVPSPGNRVTSG
jgi:hypothetical protein